MWFSQFVKYRIITDGKIFKIESQNRFKNWKVVTEIKYDGRGESWDEDLIFKNQLDAEGWIEAHRQPFWRVVKEIEV